MVDYSKINLQKVCHQEIASLNSYSILPLYLVILLAVTYPSLMQAQSKLPEPLTLKSALQAAGNPEHFEIVFLDQKISEINDLIAVENADFGVSVDLKGRLRRVGPSDAGDPDETGDSAASLLVTKPLYNFGQTDLRLESLALEQQVLLLEKQQLIEQRRQKIMENYFAVLNADNNFISENEDLAIGFIRFDRARENLELGLASEIDVLRLQSEYELIRQRRYQAENQQRLSRMILAESMGYPQELPNTLQAPEIDLGKPLNDDFDVLVDGALKSSTVARLLEGRRRVAQSVIQQASSVDGPRLDFELELSSYERESSTRDDWRATVYFDLPLYSGSNSSQVSLAQTRYQKTLAELAQLRSRLRLQILELWQAVQQNRLIAQGREITQNYRDLYLDRSRTEYELEFRSDLGDAMVQFSRARTERLKALYAFELAYQRLQSLVGVELMNRANTENE